MKRTLIKETAQLSGKEVQIEGWVHTVRDHGKITFVDVYDMTGLIQVVGKSEDLSRLRPQFVVKVEGNVQNRPTPTVNEKLPTGKVEIKARLVEILSKAQELPFDMGALDLDLQLPTLLDFRALTLRHPQVKSIFKVQAAIVDGFRKAAKNLDCTEIFVPTIAASATEGGAEVFKVDYYGHKAYMTQSPQLYKQMLVPVFERVFTIAHAYRAEPSVTTRHLSEATQLDCEIGFATFEDLLDMLEEVAITMLKYVEESCDDVFKDYKLKPIAFGKI